MKQETFAKLGNAGKRVAIAKDVILQLNAKKIRAVTGNYLELNGVTRKELDNNLGKDLRDFLNKRKKPCLACALGSCFVSLTKIEDNFKLKEKHLVYESIDDDDFRPRLNRIFGKEQIDMIESAFEISIMTNSGVSDNWAPYGERTEEYEAKLNQAKKFGGRYRGNESRLIAIMQNIIKNKGEFKPQ